MGLFVHEARGYGVIWLESEKIRSESEKVRFAETDTTFRKRLGIWSASSIPTVETEYHLKVKTIIKKGSPRVQYCKVTTKLS